MTKLQELLRDYIIVIELLSAIIGILNYHKFRNTPWRYFIYYVVIIFIFEAISYLFLDSYQVFKSYYFEYLVIPFQFIFFYWLYAINSLKKKKLFWLLLGIYLITFSLAHIFNLDKTRIVNEISYSTGVLLLLILVIMEFLNQIKSDSILYFKENLMFYVNLGVAVFYIGTLPFFAFDGFASESMRHIWSYYWTLFLSLNYVLYLTYIFGFIWAKPNT